MLKKSAPLDLGGRDTPITIHRRSPHVCNWLAQDIQETPAVHRRFLWGHQLDTGFHRYLQFPQFRDEHIAEPDGNPVCGSKSLSWAVDAICRFWSAHYGNTTIYKDENGICTQVTDLTSVGLMGMTSLDTYKCGESKMEKAFRLHMKALFEKNGRSKNSGAK